MLKLKSFGMDILLKLLSLNQDNQLKLFTLSILPMDIKEELPIMVFNSISMLDLSIPLMEKDRISKCIQYI